MSVGRRRFTVSAPDWGQTHLSSDAIVAFVDGELAPGPQARATRHLAECPECAALVRDQGRARNALRAAAAPSVPSSLLDSLRGIPQHAELPPPPAGLAVTEDGTLVSVLRPAGAAAGPAPRPSRSGRTDPPGAQHGGRANHRRLRFGAGAAVSGIALGALTFGIPSGQGAVLPAPALARGVLGGTVLGGAALGGSAAGVPAATGQGSAGQGSTGQGSTGQGATVLGATVLGATVPGRGAFGGPGLSASPTPADPPDPADQEPGIDGIGPTPGSLRAER